MTDTTIAASSEQRTRIRLFANFFKSYMSVSTVVAASVPIPVASWNLIPMYAEQKGFLTVYASMFCFLLLAFVFSIRHRLALRMFSGGRQGLLIAVLPVLFMLLTMACIITYHALLTRSLADLRDNGMLQLPSDLLRGMPSTAIPLGPWLAVSYLGIFIFAEAAFVLMAIREYLQDVMHLNENDLLRGISPFPSTTAEPPAEKSRLSNLKSL